MGSAEKKRRAWIGSTSEIAHYGIKKVIFTKLKYTIIIFYLFIVEYTTIVLYNVNGAMRTLHYHEKN